MRWAIVMACAAAPDVRIEAITVAAGNVPVDRGVQNALYTLEVCGATVPVYRGREAPLFRPLETAQFAHGQDGMGDIGLPLAGRPATPGNAVDVLRETINRYPGEIELITLAPLTNVAIAFLTEPELATKLKRCVIMGGIGSGHGNISPVAEYNIWVDPEAARIVFDSGAPIEMVGWDISRTYATFDAHEAAALRAIGTNAAAFCVDIQTALVNYAVMKSGLPGFDLPDPVAMAVALDPAIVTASKRLHVEVDIGWGRSRGQTIVDRRRDPDRAPNVTVIDAVSRAAFIAMLHRAVAAFR